MPSLRDENPLIDSDLELIIETFERGMVKSRDVDSTIAPFRRDLEAFRNLPTSVIDSIDKVPIPTIDSSNEPLEVGGVRVTTPEELSEDPTEAHEDGDTEASTIEEKFAEWVAECIPCDLRKWSKLDADLLNDIADGWKDMFGDVFDRLLDLEDLLDDGENILERVCDIGQFLKGQCLGDIEKLVFLLLSLLQRLELELSADLGIFDSLVMSILAPIFNEMMANLDMIDDLALSPIRCMLDELKYQIDRAPAVRDRIASATSPPGPLSEELSLAERHQAIRQRNRRIYESGAQSTADQAARERAEQRQEEEQNARRVLNAVGETARAAHTVADSLNLLQTYITTGYSALKQKKDHVFQMLQDLVDVGLGKWNDRMDFARGKTDLLELISILMAVINAAGEGFSCGAGSDSITEDELKVLLSIYRHPSESLEFRFENDNIVAVRRNPSGPQDIENTIRPNVDGPDGEDPEVSNIVIRRPISSCLRNVTEDEAEKVSLWIRQLEQEG